MQTHPTDDGFISAARDSTVRLWDTRKDTCRVSFILLPLHDRLLTLHLSTLQGILKTGKDPVVAYDNTGKIFAIAHNDDRKDAVHLFDTSNFEGVSTCPCSFFTRQGLTNSFDLICRARLSVSAYMTYFSHYRTLLAYRSSPPSASRPTAASSS
jgi:WD40 repeat protein